MYFYLKVYCKILLHIIKNIKMYLRHWMRLGARMKARLRLDAIEYVFRNSFPLLEEKLGPQNLYILT